MNQTAAPAAVADPEFDLDVSIVESIPVDGALLRSTDNGCTSTNDSACVTCFAG